METESNQHQPQPPSPAEEREGGEGGRGGGERAEDCFPCFRYSGLLSSGQRSRSLEVNTLTRPEKYCMGIGLFQFMALLVHGIAFLRGLGDHNFERSCRSWISHVYIVQCGLPC